MTDNEIIELLNECDVSHIKIRCVESVFSDTRGVTHFDLSRIVDVLNSQQAEIERLKSFEKNIYETVKELRNKIKAEAVKEFAERLKDLKHECGCNYRKKPVFAVTEDKIDNLVKEMVGEG